MQTNTLKFHHMKLKKPTIYNKIIQLTDACRKPLATAEIDLGNIDKAPPFTLPLWEMNSPILDITLNNIYKKDQPNILTYKAKEKVASMNHYLQFYTDGSKMGDRRVGSAFVVPQLGITKAYTLNKHVSIFTAELWAIYMACSFLNNMPSPPFKVVIFTDSKSNVLAIQNNTRNRNNLIQEIYLLNHQILTKGTDFKIVWIPSHCGIKGNDMADKAAKLAALGETGTTVDVGLSTKEAQGQIKKHMFDNWGASLKKKGEGYSDPYLQALYLRERHLFRTLPRQQGRLALRLQTDSVNFKFDKALCNCKELIDINHIFSQCQEMNTHFKGLREKLTGAGLSFSLASCLTEGPLEWTPLIWLVEAIWRSPIDYLF
jgi:ribonuclease HI